LRNVAPIYYIAIAAVFCDATLLFI